MPILCPIRDQAHFGCNHQTSLVQSWHKIGTKRARNEHETGKISVCVALYGVPGTRAQPLVGTVRSNDCEYVSNMGRVKDLIVKKGWVYIDVVVILCSEDFSPEAVEVNTTVINCD